LFLVLGCTLCAKKQTTVFGPSLVQQNSVSQTLWETPSWVKELHGHQAMSSFSVRLLDLDGKEFFGDDIVLQSVVIKSLNRKGLAENDRNGFVAAAGNGATSMNIQEPFAYKINPGDEWIISINVFNRHSEEIQFFVECTMNVDDWRDNSRLIEVDGYLQTVTGVNDDYDFYCNVGEEYRNPYIVYYQFPSGFTGTIIWAGSIFGQGGKNMYFSKDTFGEVPFSSNVHYDKISNHITFIDNGPTEINIGSSEEVRITAVSDCTNTYSKDVISYFYGYAVVEYNGLLDGAHYSKTWGYNNVFENENDVIDESLLYVTLGVSGAAIVICICLIITVCIAVSVLLCVVHKKSKKPEYV